VSGGLSFTILRELRRLQGDKSHRSSFLPMEGFKKSKGTPVSKARIVKWLVEVIQMAYVTSDIPPPSTYQGSFYSLPVYFLDSVDEGRSGQDYVQQPLGLAPVLCSTLSAKLISPSRCILRDSSAQRCLQCHRLYLVCSLRAVLCLSIRALR